MEKATITPRQSSSNKLHNINCHLPVDNIIDRYTRELQEVKDTPIGKPARYYHAYKSYTVAFNIMQLEQLYPTSNYPQKQQINDLLLAYYSYKSTIDN